VGSKTLIAAVARVYVPGARSILIHFEGERDLKSTVWNTLAGDAWFTDGLPDLHDKDAAQALQGKWLIEFAELSHFQRSEMETVKRFVSAKADHYRPSYGRKSATFPRQNIFVGSTNEAHYFKDSTGNRRYWPVQVQGVCAIAALARDRDQLWAEAVHRYQHGERWYLSADLEAVAKEEQAQRLELDDWEAGYWNTPTPVNASAVMARCTT
jgi:predicted P-loop ATPase